MDLLQKIGLTVLIAAILLSAPALRHWAGWNWFWAAAPIWIITLLVIACVVFFAWVLYRADLEFLELD